MGERKVLNKYYPPDFDPSKLPKLEKPENFQYVVRLMAPFTMRCLTCGDYVYKGKKFNARKETAVGMMISMCTNLVRTHTHTQHTPAHTTHAHTHAHTTRTHAHTTRTHTHTHARTHARTHAHTHTHTHTHTHAYTHACAHTPPGTHKRTHAHTNKHAYNSYAVTQSLSCLCLLNFR